MSLPRAYPFRSLHKYPGMRPRDVAIWDEYIDRNPGAFHHVYYNVHLGDPAADPEVVREMKKTGAFEVSQWCVDVVGYSDEKFYVIEIKPDALAGALGQALSYTKLAEAYRVVPRNSQAVVLTNDINPITKAAADLLGVVLLTP